MEDDSTVLRQVEDFSLLDMETGMNTITAYTSFFSLRGEDNIIFLLLLFVGEPISFLELGEGKRRGVLIGTLVEPLPQAWRERILSLLVTLPQSDPDIERLEAEMHAYRSSDSDDDLIDAELEYKAAHLDKMQDKPEPLDPTSIKVGDKVDAFCSRTMRWYSSKVLDIHEDPEGTMLKVHFMGWASRFDEWLDINGPHIAALGASKYIEEEERRMQMRLVPWYQPSHVLEKASETMGEIPTLMRSAPFRHENIEDWCIDYSYANPSLWLIAESGAWYKIASCSSPSGIKGAPSLDAQVRHTRRTLSGKGAPRRREGS